MSEQQISPATLILAQARAGLVEFSGPASFSNVDGTPVTISPCEIFRHLNLTLRLAPHFSTNGRYVAFVVDGAPILVCDATLGATVSRIDCVDAQYVEFSPLGNYLVTFSRHKGGADTSDGNQKVWQVADGTLVAQYSQKVFRKHSVQWTADETYMLRQVTNEVHIYSVSTITSGSYFKIAHRGLHSFRVSPTSTPLHVVVFNPEASGNPARVTLFRVAVAAGTT